MPPREGHFETHTCRNQPLGRSLTAPPMMDISIHHRRSAYPLMKEDLPFPFPSHTPLGRTAYMA